MQEENKMKTEHMRRVSIVLLAISVLFWLLRKLELLYIPGVTAFTLAAAMLLVSVGMLKSRGKQKVAGVLLLAFGLFNVVIGVMELIAYFSV